LPHCSDPTFCASLGAVNAPSISGFGHIDLTVRDAERSAQWWDQVMGFKVVNVEEREGRKSYAMVHPCGLPVILVQHPDTATGTFDETAIGLDHLAFRVPDRETLHAWARHLDQLGIAHSGVQQEHGGPLIVFRDPDNVQLEVWAFDHQQFKMNPA
jgi:catechol 2,3-dioxygenase-like lactoylglutathione lyase family enzyme